MDGSLFFLIEGSFGAFMLFIFLYFKCDGLKRETKSLKVSPTTSLMYANYVTIMSQPP